MSTETGEIQIAARAAWGSEHLTMILVCALAVLGAGAMFFMTG